VEGDILFCPDSVVSQGDDGEMGIGSNHFGSSDNNVVVKADTSVCICSESSVGKAVFQIFKKSMGLIGDNPNTGREELLKSFNPRDNP